MTIPNPKYLVIYETIATGSFIGRDDFYPVTEHALLSNDEDLAQYIVGNNPIVYKIEQPIPLQDLWRLKHDIEAKQEAERKRQEDLKQSGLSKLSSEERKALNL